MVPEVPDPDLRQARDHPLTTPPLETGRDGSRRSFGRRLVLAAVISLYALRLLLNLVRVALATGGPEVVVGDEIVAAPLLAESFFVASLLDVVLIAVSVPLWRRALAARPRRVTPVLDPLLDPGPHAHRSLTGAVELPSRW